MAALNSKNGQLRLYYAFEQSSKSKPTMLKIIFRNLSGNNYEI